MWGCEVCEQDPQLLEQSGMPDQKLQVCFPKREGLGGGGWVRKLGPIAKTLPIACFCK